MFQSPSFEGLYIKAVKYLARRPRSEKEVHDNLLKPYLKRKISDEDRLVLEQNIAQVIAKLIEQRFLNDEEFAKWWIEQRRRFKPKGSRAIMFELKQKGIPETIVKKQELGIKNQGEDVRTEKELAMDVVQRRINKYQHMPREELYRKLGGFLARRGFDMDVIGACIDEVLAKKV